MKLGIYSIKDNLIGFMSPFYSENNATAIRMFSRAANEPEKNAVNEYIENKELWAIGTFNDQTGEIISEVIYLAKGTDVLQKPQE